MINLAEAEPSFEQGIDNKRLGEEFPVLRSISVGGSLANVKCLTKIILRHSDIFRKIFRTKTQLHPQ